MSVRRAVRAFPTLMKVGFAEAVAYRAEMLVWVLATTMPLVMLALFRAVASEGPIGRFGQPEIVAYFLATFIVRQLTGSWASWQINYEVRQGTLAMRLLRPVHPFVVWAVEGLAALPMRALVSVPIAIIWLATEGTASIAHAATSWLLLAPALLGAWLLTLLANLIIGSLSLFIDSSMKVMDLYVSAYFVMSGYLIPVELFPPAVRALADVLPFRYQIGFPVELMTGAYDGSWVTALGLLAREWVLVALFAAIAALVWSRGVRRFNAYGG